MYFSSSTKYSVMYTYKYIFEAQVQSTSKYKKVQVTLSDGGSCIRCGYALLYNIEEY